LPLACHSRASGEICWCEHPFSFSSYQRIAASQSIRGDHFADEPAANSHQLPAIATKIRYLQDSGNRTTFLFRFVIIFSHNWEAGSRK
jgi:hypothetical protein